MDNEDLYSRRFNRNKLRRVPKTTEYREDSFPSTYTNQQIIEDEEDEQPKQVTIKEKVLTRKQLTNQLNKQKRDEENKREGMRKKDEKILKDPKAIKYIKAQDKEREDVIRKGKNLLLEKGVNREIQPTIFKYVFEPDRMPTKEELSVMSKQESAENARNSRGGARAGGAKVNKSTKK
jgi:signal recognition particle GTPase